MDASVSPSLIAESIQKRQNIKQKKHDSLIGKRKGCAYPTINTSILFSHEKQ